MSRTTPAGLDGRSVWAYDASLSLLLAWLVRRVEQQPAGQRPVWWTEVAGELRVHAAVSDLYFDLGLGLAAGQREELAGLLDTAASELRAREDFTPAEAAGWLVLDEHPVMFRGTEPVDTTSAAELGEALAGLIRGTLAEPPPGRWWYLGSPGGRRTISMAPGLPK